MKNVYLTKNSRVGGIGGIGGIGHAVPTLAYPDLRARWGWGGRAEICRISPMIRVKICTRLILRVKMYGRPMRVTVVNINACEI